MLQDIANLIITQMIWSITIGSKHIIFSFIFLFFLIKFWDHISWIKAGFLSLFFVIFGLIFFLFPLWLIFVQLLHLQFVLPEDTYQGNFNYLHTSLLFATCLSCVQAILLWGMCRCITIKPTATFLAIFFSNMISALLVYKLIW